MGAGNNTVRDRVVAGMDGRENNAIPPPSCGMLGGKAEACLKKNEEETAKITGGGRVM